MLSTTLQTYRSSAQYAEFDRHRLAYWHTTTPHSDECLLFIHGFPSASWDWHAQWRGLSNKLNLVAMDMLGFGMSDKPYPHRYSLMEQARFYCQLLDQMNVKHCHIVAHDYGDSVAQEILYLHHIGQTKFNIRSLTFLNGGLFSESHRPLLTQRLLNSALGPLFSRFLSRNSLRKGFQKIFGPDTQPGDDDIDTLWQLLAQKQGMRVMPSLIKYIDERKIRRADWLQAMQHTKVPMLFINGRFDPISGEHMRQRFCELVPQGKTVSLPVGHYPQIEAPEEVLTQIADFVFAQ